VQIALFQPDIAANVGAIIRLAACLDVPLTVIEPCGFVWDDRRVRRVGLDYLRHAKLERVASFAAFQEARRGGTVRLVLLTTRASRPYYAVAYRPDDILLVGRESVGVPDAVHAAADLCVRVPMAPGRRSLNVVTALAMVLGEALRQTGGFGRDLAPPRGAP
jgi:tRNA (cytidine/uridine-2'-O-)-methyltransferase